MATFTGVMHAVVVAVPLLVVLSVVVTAALATIAIRVALFGRRRPHEVRSRGFFHPWRRLRRDAPRRSRGLAPVIPLDVARRVRAAR